MKMILFFLLVSAQVYAQDTVALRQSLDKATAAIRLAFEKGDAEMVGRLHSPDVIKYFGGDHVIVGRAAVEKGAREWFATGKVEFIGNVVENTTFVGKIAIQTVIFTIKTTPKSGGEPG
jgi:ketosteroid isomerase-like protein